MHSSFWHQSQSGLVYKDLFANEETLKKICEKVVILNMVFREADKELFEDNPEECLQRDLEGSDVGTRRHSACNLVRSLSRYFEGPVTAIFSGYITMLLQEYSNDPAKNWKCKDTALFLIAAITAKTKAAKDGTTKTSDLVNIADIFASQCVLELRKPNLADRRLDWVSDHVSQCLAKRSSCHRPPSVDAPPGHS